MSTLHPAGYLIWVKGPRGPTPQRCLDRPQSIGSGYWKGLVIQITALSDDEDKIPLDDLAKKYPAPEPEDE